MRKSIDESLSIQSRKLSYKDSGVDRKQRERLRAKLTSEIRMKWVAYPYGKPLELPFGPVFPIKAKGESFLDLQIEGIGTKTLLAEIDPDGLFSIGIDGVAMVVNDVIRSGATPLLLSDAIHISKSKPIVMKALMKGIEAGAKEAGCIIASGETGDVSEILHKPLSGSSGLPFDLIVSAIGFAKREGLVRGIIDEGDIILGLESSGIHSNGVSLARRVLLKAWGGKFEPNEVPELIGRPLIKELIEPTRIYVRSVLDAVHKVGLKAAIHITGDGFGKFRRLIDFQRSHRSRSPLGVEIGPIEKPSGIFELIEQTSREIARPIQRSEMYRTFNMGYGFAVVVRKENEDELIDLFNKYHLTRRIGRVTKSGRIVIRELGERSKPLIL
jgi:phosphoribosylformylglycinamidine cyclo-ligase